MAGIDVGESNLAISFVHKARKMVVALLLINMTIHGTDKLKLGPSNYGRVIRFWMRKYKDWFDLTQKTGIEQQPLGVGRTNMHIIQSHLESAIQCMYPHNDVVLVDPKGVRKWLGTSGGAYKVRKNKSIHAGVVSSADQARMLKLFRKETYSAKTKKWTTKSKIDDVIEASEIALFVCEHEGLRSKPIEVVYEGVTDPAVYVMRDVQLHVPARCSLMWTEDAGIEEVPEPRKRKREEEGEKPKKRKRSASPKKSETKKKKRAKKA